MKKIKFFVIGYLLFLTANVVVSCTDCGGSGLSKYNFTSFDWEILSRELTGNYYQSTNIENNTVNFDKYSIDITPVIEHYAKNINLSLLNDMYACSPIDPTTDDKITNIEIITNTAFDTTHAIGSDVSAYFDINTDSQNTSISEFLNDEHESLYDFFLMLKNSPEVVGEMSFTVKITLEGKTLDYFEFTTNTVTITNN